MGMKNTTGNRSLAANKLISYGNENPKASDTAEAIAKWWIKMPFEEVLPALETLVEFGIWEKLKRDDRVLYRPIHNPDLDNKT